MRGLAEFVVDVLIAGAGLGGLSAVLSLHAAGCGGELWGAAGFA
ncbi:MAG: hypothetical protein WBF75_03675 [Pseudonocardiaceae bacterium]